MPVIVRPLYLECIKTSAEGLTEEPFLCLYQDRSLLETLGPFSMQSGDTRMFDSILLTGEQVGIILGEEDPTYNDSLGGIQFLDEGSVHARAGEMGMHRVSESDLRMFNLSTIFRELDITKIEYRPYLSGFHYAYLPHHEGDYDHNERRYRLYFYLYAHEDQAYIHPRYCLDLISLECENAQEWKDYPYIKVNGLKVWGPVRMRDRGDAATASIDVDPVTIYEVTSVMLWEEDEGNRDDLFGEFEIRIGDDFEFDRELRHTYAPDHSITGNARYTLTYRVRRRMREADGNYRDCG